MKYRIKHMNIFRYETEVEQSLNTIRLKPRNNERQRLISHHVKINPVSMTRENVDIWRNMIATFFIAEKHKELEVTSYSHVSVQRAPYIYQIQFSEEMRNIFYSQLFREHYLPYLTTSQFTTMLPMQLESIVAAIGEPDNPVKFACDLMTYLYNSITYDPYATTVETTANEAWILKRGVCQDYTHIMLGVLRHFGIPARYISGYLYVGEDDNLVGDTATHAWVEVMLPGIGWIGLDPTNNVEVLENHINLCVGRDFRDVSPIEGVYQGGEHTLEVKVQVEKIAHL
ncbi:MAG: transglutaminase family protein [Solibacillus sp.]